MNNKTVFGTQSKSQNIKAITAHTAYHTTQNIARHKKPITTRTQCLSQKIKPITEHKAYDDTQSLSGKQYCALKH